MAEFLSVDFVPEQKDLVCSAEQVWGAVGQDQETLQLVDWGYVELVGSFVSWAVQLGYFVPVGQLLVSADERVAAVVAEVVLLAVVAVAAADKIAVVSVLAAAADSWIVAD